MNLVLIQKLHKAVLLQLLITVPGFAQLIPDPTPRISITGVGVVSTQPDMANVSFGIYILDRDLTRAKKESDAVMNRLLGVLASLNTQQVDISASGINIEPKYAESKASEFTGYEISRSIDVVLRDLSKLDQLIDKAIQSGANREFKVNLLSSREKELREQAVSLAIEDAKNQATRLVSGFGAKLGAVRNISTDSRGASLYSAVSVSFGKGTFVPGTIRIEAQLSVTFLIQQ